MEGGIIHVIFNAGSSKLPTRAEPTDIKYRKSVPVDRCKEGMSPSIPELSAALSAMDLRLLSGSCGWTTEGIMGKLFSIKVSGCVYTGSLYLLKIQNY